MSAVAAVLKRYGRTARAATEPICTPRLSAVLNRGVAGAYVQYGGTARAAAAFLRAQPLLAFASRMLQAHMDMASICHNAPACVRVASCFWLASIVQDLLPRSHRQAGSQRSA